MRRQCDGTLIYIVVWIYGNNMCISMRIYYCIVVGGETQISTLSLMNACSSIDIYVDT